MIVPIVFLEVDERATRVIELSDEVLRSNATGPTALTGRAIRTGSGLKRIELIG